MFGLWSPGQQTSTGHVMQLSSKIWGLMALGQAADLSLLISALWSRSEFGRSRR